jgi:hypothetical protein
LETKAKKQKVVIMFNIPRTSDNLEPTIIEKENIPPTQTTQAKKSTQTNKVLALTQ